MPRDGKSKSKGPVRGGGSGGGRRNQPSSTSKSPSSVSGRLRSSYTNASDRIGDGEVPVESMIRHLHRPDDPVAAGASQETISETGAPSARSSLIEETFVEESRPRRSHPAEGIGVLPISGAANASISKTPEAARKGMPEDKTLSWDLTMDGGTGMRLPPFVRTCGGASGPPGSVRPEIEQMGALGRLAQQREWKRVNQNELDRVAREQRKVEEDDWTKRLQYLKDQVEAEEQRTRTLHTNCQYLLAECDRLRVQRDGEQQLLAANRAQGDRVIADRVSELRGSTT